eukprot:8528203-Pyramimonas_sp.AAC.2
MPAVRHQRDASPSLDPPPLGGAPLGGVPPLASVQSEGHRAGAVRGSSPPDGGKGAAAGACWRC